MNNEGYIAHHYGKEGKNSSRCTISRDYGIVIAGSQIFRKSLPSAMNENYLHKGAQRHQGTIQKIQI